MKNYFNKSRFNYVIAGFAPAAIKLFEWILQQNKSDKIITLSICKCMRKMGQLSRLHLFTSR